MIFVSAGTTNFPFNRLEALVLEMQKYYPMENIIFQIKQPTQKINSSKVRIYSILEPNIFDEYLASADKIVCHAGYATVIKSLHLSRVRPVVLPRIKKYGEHVNNHQVNFAKYMQKKGLISIWEFGSDTKNIKGEKINRQNLDNYLDSINKHKLELIKYLDKLTLDTAPFDK